MQVLFQSDLDSRLLSSWPCKIQVFTASGSNCQLQFGNPRESRKKRKASSCHPPTLPFLARLCNTCNLRFKSSSRLEEKLRSSASRQRLLSQRGDCLPHGADCQAYHQLMSNITGVEAQAAAAAAAAMRAKDGFPLCRRHLKGPVVGFESEDPTETPSKMVHCLWPFHAKVFQTC